MTYWSRHAKYSTSRLPRKRRTIQLRGTGEDTGKYYRCWNCGATGDTDRERTDYSSHGRGGVSVGEFAIASTGTGGDINSTAAIESPFFNFEVALEQNASGDAKEPYYSLQPSINKGCWFCGSTTWRG